jgi:hypothetical protein
LSPINSARDAADIMAAVAEAVAAGQATPGEAAEIAKVIDAYVRAYKTAELDDRMAPGRQLTDAELMRIANGGGHKTRQWRAFLLLSGLVSQRSELAGWRRSADRTCLQANSLLTGNLTGKFAICELW